MAQMTRKRDARRPITTLCVAAILISSPVMGAELLVRVTAPSAVSGEIGCSLFSTAETFPLKPDQAIAQWQPAAPERECRFKNIAPGQYAVAVSHDRNGNRRLDENFFGMPTEAWGVSRNVRPSLRAPRFEEAAISVVPDGVTEISIEVIE